MSSFCTAKATHIFFSKKFQHIFVSLNVNFKESLTNDIVSFEQLGPNRHSGSVVERPLCDREVAGSIPGRVIPKILKMVLAALSLVSALRK